MLGGEDDILGLTFFDETTFFHDVDPIRDVVGETDVVRDEDDRHLNLVAELEEHVEDGRTGAGIDHGRRLIGEEELGSKDEDARDHEALHLTAGEFEGVLIGELFVAEVDESAGLGHQLILLFSGEVTLTAELDAVEEDSIDLAEDVVGGIGVLENRLDIGPVSLFLFVSFETAFLSFEEDTTVGDGSKAQDHLGQCRLP